MEEDMKEGQNSVLTEAAAPSTGPLDRLKRGLSNLWGPKSKDVKPWDTSHPSVQAAATRQTAEIEQQHMSPPVEKPEQPQQPPKQETPWVQVPPEEAQTHPGPVKLETDPNNNKNGMGYYIQKEDK
jgi:hypothetical protein